MPVTITEEMPAKAETVANFLKGLANPHRLLILCALANGERSVSDLIEETGIAQTSMSQHLAKLREQNLVSTRKDAQSVFYRVSDPKALELLALLHDLFCPDLGGAGATEPSRS